MLVLTRKPGEQIQIGPETIITLVEVRGDKARIGISAPRDVPIHRCELFDRPDFDPTRAQQKATAAVPR